MMGKTAAFTGALAAIVFFILTLAGKPLITLTAGPDYIAAYAPMLWLAASGIVGALAFALEPMLIASGAIRQTVFVRLFVTIIFLPALYYLLLAYGVSGAGMAAVIYSLLSALCMLWAGRHLLFNNRKNYRHA